MASGLLRKRIFWAVLALLPLMAAFVCGYFACLQNQRTAGNHARFRSAQPEGDASPQVRAGVLDALNAFQAGYARRDTSAADSFAGRLFVKDADLLVLGTDESEWVRGYPAVVDFIRNDWQNWGELRINCDGAIVNAAQDVAWVATAGEVRFGRSVRPARFSAVLTRDGSVWRFRQVQFQWDDREPEVADLLHPATYVTMLRVAVRKFAPPSVASRLGTVFAH